MVDRLLRNITERVELSRYEQELCKTYFTHKRIRKKHYLLQQGEVCKHMAFVQKGLLRSYIVNEKGGEHIIQFALEGWWISDLYSFLTGEVSNYNIDALENSDLLLLSRTAEEEMLSRIPKLERYLRLLMQNSYIAMQKRMERTLRLSAEKKYVTFADTYPELIKRVPQHMIASYLGITPETLSRIRKQLSLKEGGVDLDQ
ncbi:Crp/Fnr family transcriptional regulator [Danxiaibacter flavus]|uniref:Crp/Fnr family transcriptional regulator n=1 Tax=Danxiaibacter flavus TaxID=3049108 RepID=A0ABV3ZCD9_9BACT|nr:Crp/Fnr family transcriptional regulator [Chitinophagaceae bacterium DXS]